MWSTAQGRLIAHPDISLVLRKTDMTRLAQVQAARQHEAGTPAPDVETATDIQGRQVLTAFAPVEPLGWTVFVELPVAEAYEPLIASLQRTALVLFAALCLAALAGILLARRMMVPIQALRAGAARIAGGDLTQRISVKTGDELEALADQFNDMTGRLQESYADLEKKVEVRTAELSESLEQQTATSEVLKVISSSTGELQPVFQSLLENATRLCAAKFGNLYLCEGDALRTTAMYNVPPAFAEARNRDPLVHPAPGTLLHRVIATKSAIHVPDATKEQAYIEGQRMFVTAVELGGFRAMFAVPMLKDGNLIGVIVIYRQEPGEFQIKQIELVQNFAAQAVIAIENTRLLSELRESLEQQTATAEVLKVISSSPGELQPVFDTMLAKASELCEANYGLMWLSEGEAFRTAALYGELPQTYLDQWRSGTLFRPGPHVLLSRVAVSSRPIQVADLRTDASYLSGDPLPVAAADIAGIRTLLAVPMVRDKEVVGAIGIYRKEIKPFTDKQVELVTNFAAQAVIAIENTRLLSELRESLDQQTATSHVLQAISSSPGELDPVFNAILDNAVRICGARFGNLALYDGSTMLLAATHNAPEEFAKGRPKDTAIPLDISPLGTVVRTKQKLHVADLASEEQYSKSYLVKLAGARTMIAVPMIKEGQLVGAINIYRQEVRPFADKQIALLENFAAQAVIAIENARLLSELRESLEQQTATSEVLSVMSRSKFDLEPILQSVVDTAARLCRAEQAGIFRLDQGAYRFAAAHSLDSKYLEFEKATPYVPGPGTVIGRAALTKQVARIDDVLADPQYEQKEEAGKAKIRSAIGVPLMREGEPIGVIALARGRVEPFSDREIELVTTFADQAVIAIENVRLFDEVQARTDDLTESLEQQTATSEVLKVISSSPGELDPVFQAMLANAVRICDAKFGVMFRYDGEKFDPAARFGVTPEYAALLEQRGRFKPDTGSGLGRLQRTLEVVRIVDAASESAPAGEDRPAARLGGARSRIVVPMLKDDELVGAISIYRQEVVPFTDKQIELVQNFAAQAVIAIENTRLLSELRESLEQQTATSEVLSVISSSPGELEPVFHAMLENAVRICGAKFGNLFLREGESLRIGATHGAPPAYVEFLRGQRVFRLCNLSHELGVGWLVRTKAHYQVADVAAVPTLGDELREATINLAGARTLIGVPMLKDDRVVGAIVIYRQEVRPFTDKQIELVSNFAAQAVIAIENTRLLNELRESLEQQTATSEVLKVISSSPGELQPVFDAMLENAVRICEAQFGVMQRFEGESFYAAAMLNIPRALSDFLRERGTAKAIPGSDMDNLYKSKQVIHTLDMLRAPVPSPPAKLAGGRTQLAVPMLKDDELVGAIVIYRKEVRPFSENQIELVQNFAAQAVIAIENTRLLKELHERTDDLSESLQQQTATSEILQVISNSPTDSQPAFDAIVRSGLRLFPDAAIVISLPDGDQINLGAIALADAEDREALRARYPMPLSREYITGTAILDRREMDIADARETPAQLIPGGRNFLASGHRAITVMPMMRGETAIGALSVVRRQPGPLSEKQRGLLRTFASQAVIAIENTRLFNELRESLQQQTATSEVLKVISRSTFDLKTVLDTLTASAARVCAADKGAIMMRDGDTYRIRANYGFADDAVQYAVDHPLLPDRGSVTGRVALEGKAIHIPDVLADPEYLAAGYQKAFGYRTNLGVPLLREGTTIGVFTLTRDVVNPFTEKQIELVSDLRRPGGDRHRERPPVRRNPGQEPPARGSQQAQVAVPRQHEPRTAHADERHSRLYRTDHGQHLRRADRKNARRAHPRAEQRQAPARADQRRARSVQDRSRAIDADAGRLFGQGYRAQRVQLGRVAGQEQETGAESRTAAKTAGRARRRTPAHAGAAQSCRQFDQIHRQGRGRDQGGSRQRIVHDIGARYRPGHRDRGSAQNLRRVPAGRFIHHQGKRRHRSRPRHFEADRGDAWRPLVGRLEPRARVDFLIQCPPQSRTTGGASMSKRILVVEDQEDNRQILRDLLGSIDVEMIEAHDGAAAVAQAEKHRPDLILMDIQLPVMDGYEATRRIKANPELKAIPIVVVTSYALSGDEAKARAAGCDAYVTKPYSPRQLLAKINEYLK